MISRIPKIKRKHCKTQKFKLRRKVRYGGFFVKDKSSKWMEIPIRKLMLGGGNFLNPRTSEECYEPMKNDTFQFHMNMDLAQLKISFGAKLGDGTSNVIQIVSGKEECLRMEGDLPILIRISKNNYNVTKPKDVKKILEYEEEMKLLTLFSYYDYAPKLYMCGTYVMKDNYGKETLRLFSIMERASMDFGTYLLGTYELKDFNNLLEQILTIFMTIGTKYCYLDVKPINTVVKRNKEDYQALLIDIDPMYMWDFSRTSVGESVPETVKNRINSICMIYLFLNHIVNYYAFPYSMYGYTTKASKENAASVVGIVNSKLEFLTREANYNDFCHLCYSYVACSKDGNMLQNIFVAYHIPIPSIREVEEFDSTDEDPFMFEE